MKDLNNTAIVRRHERQSDFLLWAQKININVEFECNNGETQRVNGTRAKLVLNRWKKTEAFKVAFYLKRETHYKHRTHVFFFIFFYFQPDAPDAFHYQGK